MSDSFVVAEETVFQDCGMIGRLRAMVGRKRGRAAAALLVVGIGLAAVAASQAAAGAVNLLKVRVGGDAAQTRTVVELDGVTAARVLSDGSADRRVVVLLTGVKVAQVQQGPGRGVVKAWLLDPHQGGARLQMDLAADGKVSRRFLLPPADGVTSYRYVIDVAATPGAVMTASAAPKPPAPAVRTQFLPVRTPVSPVKSTPLPLKRVVVIDAGHGGRDSGAVGAKGLEKDLNLAAAQTLADKLTRTGRYKVVMTRSSDVYVPLESRVRIAQRADADLFISIHADSGPEPGLKGASVYTLSDKATQRATRFVSNDNWFMKASLAGDQGVRDILFDLTQRATRNRSAIFAQTLVSRIEGKAPLLRRSHRDAGFMVLLAPDVPAVLLEMGFVSNSEDEARLRDPASRSRLMAAVAQAVDEHFGESIRLAGW